MQTSNYFQRSSLKSLQCYLIGLEGFSFFCEMQIFKKVEAYTYSSSTYLQDDIVEDLQSKKSFCSKRHGNQFETLSRCVPFFRRLVRAGLPNRQPAQQFSPRWRQASTNSRYLVCEETWSVTSPRLWKMNARHQSLPSVAPRSAASFHRTSYGRPDSVPAVSPLLSPHCVLIMTFSGLATLSDQPSLDCFFFGPGVLKNVQDQGFLMFNRSCGRIVLSRLFSDEPHSYTCVQNTSTRPHSFTDSP